MRTLPLDPSLVNSRVGSKAGFDLTWPFRRSARLEASVPEPPRYEGKEFLSSSAALKDGRNIEELMTAIGSRDGRENRAGAGCAAQFRTSTATTLAAMSSPDQRQHDASTVSSKRRIVRPTQRRTLGMRRVVLRLSNGCTLATPAASAGK